MIKDISIVNYKSILKLDLNLGLINVFIGANGSGKSNLLEAIAMPSLWEEAGKINIEGLLSKGVRVTKPTLTLNSFLGKRQKNSIDFIFRLIENSEIFLQEYTFECSDISDIYSEWKKDKPITDIISSFDTADKRRVLNKILKTDDSLSSDVKKIQLPKDVIEKLFKIFAESWTNENELLKSILSNYLIYSPNISALRGLSNDSKKTPLGINGEGLDLLIASFKDEERKNLLSACVIDWLEDVLIDNDEEFKKLGYKLGRGISNLFFVDKYMQKKNNIFSAENANEGALFILFYLALFISDKTPSFFAIDNIESGLNPRLCRYLMKTLTELSKKNNKQALITTHNPAVLDGLDLHDDEQRLFVVSRNDEGQTKVERIKLKPKGQENIKLSDLWMSGQLGGIPEMF